MVVSNQEIAKNEFNDFKKTFQFKNLIIINFLVEAAMRTYSQIS